MYWHVSWKLYSSELRMSTNVDPMNLASQIKIEGTGIVDEIRFSFTGGDFPVASSAPQGVN